MYNTYVQVKVGQTPKIFTKGKMKLMPCYIGNIGITDTQPSYLSPKYHVVAVIRLTAKSLARYLPECHSTNIS
jgi:hypothetical protein